MKVGIVQSSFIPWRGYFDLIDSVDLFLYLDNVPFGSKGSWRNRNRIMTSHGTRWLTVPVTLGKEGRDCTIENAGIDYSQHWVTKQVKTLTYAYGHSRFFTRYADVYFGLLGRRYDSISQLNTVINNWILGHLEISTPIRMASEFDATKLKTDRLIQLLTQVGATTYISGPAAKAYLEVEKFRAAEIGLEYKSYDYPEYPQSSGAFSNDVSVIDLLFNCGPDSRRYLKSKTPNDKVL